MSNTLGHPQDNETTPMQIDSIQSEIKSTLDDNDDEFSDFADDPEELEIIDRLLLEVASKQQQRPAQEEDAPLVVVTDIEDYEAPRGVRLPKVLGLETARHQWEIQRQQPQQRGSGDGGDQSLRDQSGEFVGSLDIRLCFCLS